MVVVPAHQFKGKYTNEQVDSAIEFARNELGSRLEENPVRTGGVHAEAQRTRAGGAYNCGRVSDMVELLGASCDCAGALFAAAAAPPGSQVRFPYRASMLAGPSGSAGFGAGPGPWITALLTALALRRADTVKTLIDIPGRMLNDAPGERDECFVHLVYAFQAFSHGESASEPLAEFERLSRPENLKIATPRVLERFRALTPALKAIDEKHQAELTSALVALLGAHKRAFGKGKEAESHANLFDIRACGIAVLARDRGLQLEVESSYLPTGLVSATPP